ncbi:MAG: cytochrome D1 domain-containing protein, partial [Alphaproteobacteria bacterium]|nr:cytochrome D1 domain-containing protein [Alphaproteobacteria bacterium]
MRAFSAVALGLLLLAGGASAETIDAAALYKTHCADCHGATRLGGQGPALMPESLRRLRKKKALRVIAEGRTQTQMPPFTGTLSEAEIAAVVAYVYRPPAVPPRWAAAEIRNSRVLYRSVAELPAAPTHGADPLNLFVVVESGDHHVTILDGDRLMPLTRFQSRYALHGGPKFSPDGRFVYFASRDGWIAKYDLHGLDLVAEVRAGINTRNLAISADGKVLAAANYLPHTLVLLDAADLSLLDVIEV